MISFDEFKSALKTLHGEKIIKTTSSSYHEIEVSDFGIYFIRKKDFGRTKDKEIIELHELYEIYSKIKSLTGIETNKLFNVGNHRAPANCFLKKAGLIK